jgi:hypothetical protein
MHPTMKRNNPSRSSPTVSSRESRNASLTFAAVRRSFLIAALCVVSAAFAKEKPAEHGLPVVYNDVRAGVAAIDRDARKAYAGRFRIIEVTQRDGFTPGRMKAPADMFVDPRSMREKKAPGKIVFLFVVTADGRAIEPRVLQSSHPRASDYMISSTLARRFAPARLRGVAVASLHSVDLDLKVEEMGRNQMANDGLGLPGYRDR